MLLRFCVLTVIIYVRAQTQDGINCSFSQTLCGWAQDKMDKFDWNIGDQDYAYIESTVPHQPNQNAKLISPLLQPINTNNNTQCFEFYYNMFGVRINSLNVYLQMLDGSHQLIWHREYSQGNQWIRGYRTIRSDTQYKIVLEALTASSAHSTNNDGIIAIKDIHLSPRVCPPFTEMEDDACDFEENFCKWKVSNGEWKRGTSRDVQSDIKPKADHTTGSDNGYFAYILGEDKIQNELPPLEIFVPKSTEMYCLQFYYYIKMGSSPKINVTIVSDKTFEVLSTHGGIEYDHWSFAETTLSSPDSYRVLLVGIIEDEPTGFLAIDDTIILHGACEQDNFCGFESGFCNWRNVFRDDESNVTEIVWLRSMAGESSLLNLNLPQYDSDGTDSGYFLFVDMSNSQRNTQATLSSKPLFSQTVCFTFHYNINRGCKLKDCGTLQIIKKTCLGETLISTLSKQTKNWEKIKVDITSYDDDCDNKPFEIYIRAITGSNTGYITIDELFVQKGSCEPTTHTTHTTHTSTKTSTLTSETLKTDSTAATTYSTTQSTPEEQTTTQTSTTTTTTSTSPPITSSTSKITPTTPNSTSQSTTTNLPYRPMLPQNKCEYGKVDCGDNECILAIYLCDGQKDCKNGADEECSEDHKCNLGDFYCEGFTKPICLGTSHVCDGHQDCINNADENSYFCGTCSRSYCVTGRCYLDSFKPNGLPVCVCTQQDHTGHRCQYLKSELTPATAKTSDSSSNEYLAYIAIPTLAFLVVIIIILSINLYCHRKHRWYRAAGLLGKKKTTFYQRNSMTDMQPTDTEPTEVVSDDVGESAPSRRPRDDAISLIHTPLSNYRLHSLYIGQIVVDSDGNIVAVSDA